MIRLTPLGAAALLVACSENNLNATNEPKPADTAEDDAPDIEVSPGAVDFGEVGLGSENTATLTVSNVGGGMLRLDSPRLAADTASVTLTALSSPMLAAGQSATMVVTWSSADGKTLADVVELPSNDPDEALTEVPLTGTLPHGEIELTPAWHDFGTVAVGITDAALLTVTNVGAGPLTVSSVALHATDADLQLLDAGALAVVPATLAPGDSTELTVTYAPSDGSGDEGTLAVFSDDPDTPEADAVLVGQGEDPDPCEGLTQHVKLTLTADDAWQGWLDGTEFTAPGQNAWSSIDTLEWDLPCGNHALALYATDTAQVIAGVLAAVEVEGTVTFVSGPTDWTMTDTSPPADWSDVAFDDSSWHIPEVCGDTSPWGSTPQPLYDLGAQWIWWTSDCRDLGEAWLRLNFTVP